MKISVKDLLKRQPCAPWDGDSIRSVFGGRDEVDVSEFLRIKDIPATNRAWAVCDSRYMPDALAERFIAIAIPSFESELSFVRVVAMKKSRQEAAYAAWVFSESFSGNGEKLIEWLAGELE